MSSDPEDDFEVPRGTAVEFCTGPSSNTAVFRFHLRRLEQSAAQFIQRPVKRLGIIKNPA